LLATLLDFQQLILRRRRKEGRKEERKKEAKYLTSETCHQVPQQYLLITLFFKSLTKKVLDQEDCLKVSTMYSSLYIL
jgi:hypothetical protein